MALNYGWVYIYGKGTQSGTNMQLACRDPWRIRTVEDPYSEPLPGDTRISYNLQVISRKLILKNIVFKTTADAELCVANLKAMNGASAFSLKLKIISAGTFLKYDGTNTEMTVYYKDFDLEKLARYDGSVYVMSKMTFIEA